MKPFSQNEIEEITIPCIKFPHLAINKQNEVVEISEVTALKGMADNDGIPTSMDIEVHRKGQPIQKLSYTLEQS